VKPKIKTNDLRKICRLKLNSTLKSKLNFHSENNFVCLLKLANKKEAVIKITDHDWKVLKEKYLTELITKKTNIPTPKILELDTSHDIIPHSYFIMQKIEGQQLYEEYKQGKCSLKLFQKMGEILAKLHTIKFKKSGFIFANSVQGENWGNKMKKSFSKNFKILTAKKLITQKEIEKQLDKKIFNPIKNPCLLYYDYGPWQLYAKDNKITGIFDFEWACSGPAIYDIADGYVSLLYESPEAVENYFKGYRKISKIKNMNLLKSYSIQSIIEKTAFFAKQNRLKEARKWLGLLEKL